MQDILYQQYGQSAPFFGGGLFFPRHQWDDWIFTYMLIDYYGKSRKILPYMDAMALFLQALEFFIFWVASIFVRQKNVQNKKRHCGAHLEATDMEEILKVQKRSDFGVALASWGWVQKVPQEAILSGKWGGKHPSVIYHSQWENPPF